MSKKIKILVAIFLGVLIFLLVSSNKHIDKERTANPPDLPHLCTEMVKRTSWLEQNMPNDIALAVGEHGKYWKTGSTIVVGFNGGSAHLRERIQYYANQWTNYANLRFQFQDGWYNADIRISFQRGGSWSMVGTDAYYASSSRATMNFGWLTDHSNEGEIRRVVLHEFGHALGLHHEHQHPTNSIPWNRPAVYDYYATHNGWDRYRVDAQVFQRYSTTQTQYSHYDPNSIMHYPIPNRLTHGDYEVQWNNTLSHTDKEFIQQVYPGRQLERDEVIIVVSNTLGKNALEEWVYICLDNCIKSIYLTKDKPQDQIKYKINRNQRYNYAAYSLTRVGFLPMTGYGTGQLSSNSPKTFQLYGEDQGFNRVELYLN